jgi:type VI secretion system protein ImpA
MSGGSDIDAALPAISDDDPCGPDLDAEGDSDYLNFMAKWEAQLPASYFPYDQEKAAHLVFDPKSIDLTEAKAGALRLLARSRDVRLLTFLAKVDILNKDLGGFARWMIVIARLLADQWDAVHPRGEGGDFGARAAQLSTLDDVPVVIMPLQYAPLVETRRDGALTFRMHLFALGEASPIESERTRNIGDIDKIFLEGDLPALVQTLALLRTIKTAIAEIAATTREKSAAKYAVTFTALTPLIERMAAFVQAAITRRDPSLERSAAADDVMAAEEASPQISIAFASLSDADAALASALGYFVSTEPSSAAVLLLDQARQLLGKNLYEVMKIIAPNHADAARIFIGGEPAFAVPISGIASKRADPMEAASAPAPATSRAAALSLIDAVSTYLRNAEPSSPVPMMLDRARALATRDFFGLLKELLSDDALSKLRRS